MAGWDDISDPVAGSPPPTDVPPSGEAGIEDHVNAIISHESGGDPMAVGDKGLAIGMGQMHPEVRQAYGVTPESTPEQQKAAVRSYFTDLWNKHKGNPDDAVSEYHLGATRYKHDRNSPNNRKYLAGHYKHLNVGTGTIASAQPTAPAAANWDTISDPAATTTTTPAAAEATPPETTTTPSLGELEQKRAIEPAVAGVKGGAEAIAGGEVDVPGYGTVPAVTPEETLTESVERAPARFGAAVARAVPPVMNLPGEALAGAPVQKLTGSETAGDVASTILNLLTPFLGAKALGVGAKATEALEATTKGGTIAERTGEIAQKVVPRTYKTLKDAANATYEHAGALAEEAGTTVTKANIAAVQKDAQKFLDMAGTSLTGRARTLVENIATHPGDVPYAEWKTLQGELREMALNPEQHAIADSFVQKGIDRIAAGAKGALKESVAGTPAGEALAYADSQWKNVVDQRRLLRRVGAPKTGEEAAKALGDATRERLAMKGMSSGEREAYNILRKAATVQKYATKGLIGIEAGRLIFNPPKEFSGTEVLENVAPVVLGLALRNPKVAILVARGLKTPPTAAVATTVLNKILDYAGKASMPAGQEGTENSQVANLQ
jgi:hypothetical protein